MKKLLFILSTSIIFLSSVTHLNCAYATTNTNKPEYLNGGIGEEELDNMRIVAKSYSLRMVFTEGEGAYIANVIVGIYDKTNQLVFYKKNSGPYLYVKLPDGDYKVVAIYKGEKRSHKVTLNAATSKKIFFNWPDQNQADTPSKQEQPEESSEQQNQ